MSNSIAMAANSYSSPAHFVALRRDGKVFAWGLNNDFGSNAVAVRPVPNTEWHSEIRHGHEWRLD